MCLFTDSIHKYADYPLFGMMYVHAHTIYQAADSSFSRGGLESRLDLYQIWKLTAQLNCTAFLVYVW